MKISILMPSYKREGHIRDAVMAVKGQTHQDWELVIKEGGDGAGHANIRDIVSSDERIVYVHSKDRGITHAVNTAMGIATGDVFMWANDDDLLLPEALSMVSSSIGVFPWGHGKIKMTRNGEFRGEMGYPTTIEQMRTGNQIPQPAVFWTREAYEVIGPMSEAQDLVSDYEYWCRLITKYPNYAFIDRYLAEYKLHDDQITSKNLSEQLRQASIVKVNI